MQRKLSFPIIFMIVVCFNYVGKAEKSQLMILNFSLISNELLIFTTGQVFFKKGESIHRKYQVLMQSTFTILDFTKVENNC